ncbi:hypothetical protein BKA56DRAFT_731615 [Ilyonectria sp. MPI-CAGE-AT-0026]|nr:hypothetical protein BKA56DRAFT_731615 [Ilyonectria sp. MPI-CAGE-AT-0026]
MGLFSGSPYTPDRWAFDRLGLDAAYMRLTTLAANPDMLQRERHRFSISPPPPGPSPTFSTLSGDPTPRLPSLKPGEREADEVDRERESSRVSGQFFAEASMEARRLYPVMAGCMFVGFDEVTRENVKADWGAQGIWDERWNNKHLLYKYNEKWKHEQPLTDDEEEGDEENGDGETELLEPASEYKPHRPPSGLFSTQPPLSPSKPPTTKNKKDRKTREAAERDRDASRPFQRFIYLVSRERERILATAGSTGPDSTGPTTAPLDINTQAYTNVKANWVERGLWYRKWGQLPGMNWKHELPPDPDERWMEGYTPPPAPLRSPSPIFGVDPPMADGPGGTQEVADPSAAGGNTPLILPSEVPRRRGHVSPAEVYPTIETPDEVSVSITKLLASPATSPDPEQGPGRAGGTKSSLRSRKLDLVVSGSISKASKGPSPAGRRTRSRKTPVFAAQVQDQAKTRRSARLQALDLKVPRSMPTRDVGNAKSVAECQEINKLQRTTRGKRREM